MRSSARCRLTLFLAAFSAIVVGCNAGHPLRTFLAVYRRVTPDELKILSSHQLLVNGADNDRERAAVQRIEGGPIFLRYLTMSGFEKGQTRWGDTILARAPEYLLPTIQGTRDKRLPFRERYVWGYLSPFDSSQQTVNYYVLDPRSEGWAAQYGQMAVDEVNSMRVGDRTGIFVDNVWPFYTYFFRKLPNRLQVDFTGDGAMSPADDQAWADAIVQFSGKVRSFVGARTVLIANFGTRWPHGTTAFRILTNGPFDGVMNEEFAHFRLSTDSASYPPVWQWEEDITSLRIADSLGKFALAQSAGLEEDHDARLFCVASYLLGAGSTSMYSYRFREGYDAVYTFPEFDLDLGGPREQPRLASDLRDRETGLYRRAFADGWVAVNMSAATMRVELRPDERLLSLQGGTAQRGGKAVWKSEPSKDLGPRRGIVVRRID